MGANRYSKDCHFHFVQDQITGPVRGLKKKKASRRLNMENLLQLLKQYRPFNGQESRDREEICRLLRERDDVWDRSGLAHMTASAWVASPDRKYILMAYHNLYQSWSWLGGHADGEKDLLAVAMREVQEESGLTEIRPVSRDIFSLEILCVNGHEKRGVYVPSHLHLNVTYLIEGNPEEKTRIKADENSAVRWFDREDAVSASSEVWFRERIYRKLNEKMMRFHAAQSL